jgi:response regulator RpfG family c-di-GMP phosphodiesterase
MTANAMKGDREKCLEAGMNDYIAKPIEPEELYHTLAKYLLAAQSTTADVERKPNAFLLNIAGGDKKMAMLILDEVINQLPGEIKELQKIIDQKNVSDLSVVCHHLVSTISPLGNDTEPIKKVEAVELAIAGHKDPTVLLDLVRQLKVSLEKLYDTIKTN